jgi:hypothetical membrane protein
MSQLPKQLWHSIAGCTGIVLFWVCTIISLSQYPTPVSILNNWISDAGSLLRNPRGAPIFDIGFFIAGILFLPVFVRISARVSGEKWRHRVVKGSQLAGGVYSLSIVMGSVFNEDFIVPHDFFAYAGFFGMLAFSALIIIAFWPLREIMRATKIAGLVAAIILATFLFVQHVPVIEWACAVSFDVFYVFVAIELARLPNIIKN